MKPLQGYKLLAADTEEKVSKEEEEAAEICFSALNRASAKYVTIIYSSRHFTESSLGLIVVDTHCLIHTEPLPHLSCSASLHLVRLAANPDP